MCRRAAFSRAAERPYEECGEKAILLGSEEDWRFRCTIFVCKCRHKLTLDGPPDEEILATS